MKYDQSLAKYSAGVRVAFRHLRAKFLTKPAGTKALDDLIVDDAIFADKNDRTLKSVYLRPEGPDIILNVPAWMFTSQDILKIEHSRDNVAFVPIHSEIIRYFDDLPDMPYPVTLDKTLDALQSEGVHYFRSYVFAEDNESEDWSDPTALRFDRYPPYYPNLPTKFSPVALVTDASLAANGGKVILKLPAYDDWQVGDVVRWYWLKELTDDIGDIEEVGTAPATGEEQDLEVPEAFIRKVGDGGVYAVYVLMDKAGNVSLISDYVPVAVALDTLPTVFDDPEVPLATAADGYLIDQADAAEGVEVWVPLFKNWKSTDTVAVTWKSHVFKAEPVGSSPGEVLSFKIDSAILLQEYDGASLPDETEVSYDVYRGTHKLGGAKTTVYVNFESIDPGWPDPDWPDPVYDDLEPAHVYGRGGTSTEDKLDNNDNGKNADIKIVLIDLVKEKDILTLDWGGQAAVATATVAKEDVDKKLIGFEVPWAAIEAGGNNPALPIRYWVKRPSVHNPIRSVDTQVSVSAVIITAEPVDFLDKNSLGQLTCKTICESLPHADGGAVQLVVPDLTKYEEYGTISEVKITWWAVKGGRDDQGEVEVPGVKETFTVPIGQDYPVGGFVWRVPYVKHVAPTFDPTDPQFYQARARVTYTFTAGGENIVSKRGDIVLAMYTPGGACDLSSC